MGLLRYHGAPGAGGAAPNLAAAYRGEFAAAVAAGAAGGSTPPGFMTVEWGAEAARATEALLVGVEATGASFDTVPPIVPRPAMCVTPDI